MVKVWDDRLKRLAGVFPGDFVDWLLPGAQFVGIASLDLKTLTKTISTDTLFEVSVKGKKALLHIEFQRRPKADMARRVWEYNVLATLQHECPVYSFVIYLRPGGKIPESPLTWGLPDYERVHTFRYTTIKLWELPVEELKKTGLKGLLPLCLLAKDGAQRDVAQEVFKGTSDHKELLALALTLASMVLTDEADQQWLEGKVAMLEDIVRDTWFYQKILKEGLAEGRDKGRKEGLAEGREKGLAEGREEGRKEATLETLRFILLDTVEERFPALLELARMRVEQMQNPLLLRKLNTRIVLAQTPEEAERAFRDD
jgi:predicted transposase YdaD